MKIYKIFGFTCDMFLAFNENSEEVRPFVFDAGGKRRQMDARCHIATKILYGIMHTLY
jgi:hypothetical protein